jgi:hypothetical protein
MFNRRTAIANEITAMIESMSIGQLEEMKQDAKETIEELDSGQIPACYIGQIKNQEEMMECRAALKHLVRVVTGLITEKKEEHADVITNASRN